ncbi:MAG: hypothetical protein IT316_02365 [Anaerolineales bacterium]|nr:hypothetical protein [Anaerolineales bacterium]
MPRIRCHYIDCVFLDDGYCGAAAVEFDPDAGCMTFSRMNDLDPEKDWEDETEDLDEWEELEGEDEDDEIWLDEDQDY